MRLIRLEVRNFRSIEDQASPSDTISLGGLNCLVGKNNAGKSNILEAIQFLLGDESLSKEMYLNHDESNVIDVRGYFEVNEEDFDRLKNKEKVKNIKNEVLDDGTIGICQRSTRNDLEVMGYYPTESRLQKETFDKFHERTWSNRDTKAEFRDKMKEEYPELEDYLREGKEKNKGEWANAYNRLTKDRPADIDFELKPAAPATGISADLKNMLPRIVMVPAVKDVSDATKTSKRGELGTLIHELASEIEDELDEEIEEALSKVYNKLNVVRDEETGEIKEDKRVPGIQEIESRLSKYVSEAFRDVSMQLEFPPPESREIFKDVQVWVEEEDFSRVKVEEVGEGVKRTLIFSLFRTLADLRTGSLLGDSDQISSNRRPLLILYEEAELFLHPNLQGILVDVLESLKSAGDQVVFTTHSPFMIDDALDRINIVRKYKESGTIVQACGTVLDSRDPRDVNRLTQIQNISSYIFSDRVVLVEGESDRIVIEKLAKFLNEDWDFKRQGIPVLPVGGKGNIPLFKDFLSSLNIRPFAVTDLDAVNSTIGKLIDGDDTSENRQELLEYAKQLVESGEVTSSINRGFINGLASGYQWNDVWDKLEDLLSNIDNGNDVTQEQVGALEKLLKQAVDEDAKTNALQSSQHEEIEESRLNLVESLLSEDILMLTPDLEQYYPNGESGKVKRAVQFEPENYSLQEIRNYFHELRDGSTDMEKFLNMVFLE